MKECINLLINVIDLRRRQQFFYALFLIFVSSILEILTLLLTIPFVQVLVAGGTLKIDELFFYSKIASFASDLPSELSLRYVGIILMVCVTASLISRLFTIILSSRFVFGVAGDVDKCMLNIIFNTNYEDLIKIVPSNLVDTLTTKAHGFTISVLYGGMAIIIASVMTLVILAPLLYYEFLTTFLALLTIVIFYISLTKFVGKPIRKYSSIIMEHSENYIKTITESISNIRDLILFEKIKFFLKRASDEIINLRQAQMSSAIIAATPRFFVEFLAIFSISVCAILLQENGHTTGDILGGIAAMFIAAQRLLPVLQQAFHGYTDILRHKQSTMAIFQILSTSRELTPLQPVEVNKSIEFIDLRFKYNDHDKFELRANNVYFERGEVVAIIGDSGSGKSTLVDLLMGLLIPRQGDIKIDDVRFEIGQTFGWRRNIAHVAQKLHFISGTLAENIAFGTSEESVDLGRIKHCLRLVNWNAGSEHDDRNVLEKVVLAGAVNLSGGERQRIGIARALYLNRVILVLDEATNALNLEAELEILDNILNDNPRRIVLIINHRPDSLIRINRIYKVIEGAVAPVSIHA